MSGYKRMISYMYNYEQGIKKNNIGYARIEARNGQCKFTLYLQTPGHMDNTYRTYLIRRVENGMKLIPLGDVIIKNQQINNVFLTDEMDILKSGYGLSDICGVLIFLREESFFATQWDSKGILLKEVMQGLKPKSSTNLEMLKASNVEENLANDDRDKDTLAEDYADEKGEVECEALEDLGPESLESKAVEVGEVGPKTVGHKDIESESLEFETVRSKDIGSESLEFETVRSKDIGPENLEFETVRSKDVGFEWLEFEGLDSKELESENLESEEVGPELVDFELAKDKEMNPETLEVNTEDGQTLEVNSNESLEAWNQIRKTPSQNRTQEETEESDIAQYMFDHYPKIKAFEDGNVITCVKIEPKDIGNLPKDTWGLMNNSFILHGYYGHNHLIFAKARVGREYRYILGIPGVFHNREKFMARMFGFENFKPAKRREVRQGEFGYWYMYIKV